MRSNALACLIGLAACANGSDGGGGAGDDEGGVDAAAHDGAPGGDDAGGGGDGDGGGGGGDDGGGGIDAGDTPPPDATASVITGGPCLSGEPGATGYRIRWADGGSTTYPVYEVNGIPGNTDDHAGAYGYVIGFQPQFVDPYLGDGGLLLDGSSFIDLELSTAGLASIGNATLSIFGRSYNTTTSGSFNWQTFEGVGATPTNSVSNVAPYQWYSGDMTGEISAGDDSVLIRIEAGPSSGSLVVHRVELCLQAS
jgi:hypothetical protein